MKRIFLIAIALQLVLTAASQNVGIGTESPAPSAQLDVSSTNKGILIPRMTLVQRTAIPAPATGLLIYQTNELPGFYYFTGSSWLPLKTAESEGESWKTTGNSGTVESVNFLGTKDDQPLSFRVDNVRTGYLGGQNGNIFWGRSSGAGNTTGQNNIGIGISSLYNNQTGADNIAIGAGALANDTRGDANCAFGSLSLLHAYGYGNTAVGYASLSGNGAGQYNTALGYQVRVDKTNLINATAIGARAMVRSSNSIVLGSIKGENNATENVNVGIGILAPQHLMHIKGESSFGGKAQLCLEESTADFARFKFINTGRTSYWDIAARTSLQATDSRLNFYFEGAGDILSLYGNGNAVLKGVLVQNSDLRLKTNIHLLSNSLAGILALSGYQYQWKDAHRGDAVHIGLLAQEVKEQFPELVVTDDKGMLAVSYAGLVPVIIEAMKEQQKMIKRNQEQIAAQGQLIMTMQKEFEQLKAELRK